jgi:cell division septation protein DedD
MHAVLPPPVQLMVQIAAVSHQEDADVLSTALRKRGYAVAEKRDPVDGLIHVRMGPFNSHDDANRWRQKLLDDGYNAMIQ